MEKPPRILPVPAFHHELTIKATHTGIVLLKDGRYKKRYTGSKYSTIDINGKIYRSAADLKKAQALESELRDPGAKKAKKKGPITPVTAPDIENLDGSKDKENISTTKKRSCEYRVNKMEVRQRILAMINTMRGSKELYFWTVTFPAAMPDDRCYQAFNTWLTTLRQKKCSKIISGLQKGRK